MHCVAARLRAVWPDRYGWRAAAARRAAGVLVAACSVCLRAIEVADRRPTIEKLEKANTHRLGP